MSWVNHMFKDKLVRKNNSFQDVDLKILIGFPANYYFAWELDLNKKQKTEHVKDTLRFLKQLREKESVVFVLTENQRKVYGFPLGKEGFSCVMQVKNPFSGNMLYVYFSPQQPNDEKTVADDPVKKMKTWGKS